MLALWLSLSKAKKATNKEIIPHLRELASNDHYVSIFVDYMRE